MGLVLKLLIRLKEGICILFILSQSQSQSQCFCNVYPVALDRTRRLTLLIIIMTMTMTMTKNKIQNRSFNPPRKSTNNEDRKKHRYLLQTLAFTGLVNIFEVLPCQLYLTLVVFYTRMSFRKEVIAQLILNAKRSVITDRTNIYYFMQGVNLQTLSPWDFTTSYNRSSPQGIFEVAYK